MRDKRILFQGDSITDGNRYKEEDTRWDGNHQIGHSYAFTVTGYMMSHYTEQHLRFYNRGVSGNTVLDLERRWEDASLLMNPDVLSILVGTNDMSHCEPMERSEDYFPLFDSTYRSILTRSRENNPDLKLIMLEPFRLHATKNESEEKYRRRRELLQGIQDMERKIAADFGATFIPLQNVFDEACNRREASYWSWDGIHPTEAGHYLIAQEWIRHAEKVVLE